MMDDTIGLAAGKVWDFLHSNGGGQRNQNQSALWVRGKAHTTCDWLVGKGR